MLLFENFKQNLEKILTGNKPEKIAVAVSGGSDSLALTLLLHKWAILNKVDLTAITVDHNLRPESKNEADAVHKFMEAEKIKHVILTYDGKIPSSNIENIARNYRYKMIFKYMNDNDIKTLFIGHNKDEEIETFLLNLTRGSGVYGLSGISEISKRDDITIIRPMLVFTKNEIKEFLTNNNIIWIEDPSNNDEKYKRVKIRKLKSVFENLGLSTDRIKNTIENMKLTRELYDFYINDCIKKSVKIIDNNVEIFVSEILQFPKTIILKVLGQIVKNASGNNYPPRLKNILLLYDKIKAENDFKITLQHLIITGKNGKVYLTPENRN